MNLSSVFLPSWSIESLSLTQTYKISRFSDLGNRFERPRRKVDGAAKRERRVKKQAKKKEIRNLKMYNVSHPET